MIRSALLLSAAFLAAACFACAPPPPVAGLPPPPPQKAMSCTASDLSSFVPSVSILDTTNAYDPNDPDPNKAYGTPPSVANASPTGNIAADLAAAFAAAPDFFRRHLCSLDGVYIDPTPCTGLDGCAARSWGFRDPKSGKMYIGLSQN